MDSLGKHKKDNYFTNTHIAELRNQHVLKFLLSILFYKLLTVWNSYFYMTGLAGWSWSLELTPEIQGFDINDKNEFATRCSHPVPCTRKVNR